MRIKRHCKNCGAVIDMSATRHYVVAKSQTAMSALSSPQVYYDAFDCQNCGCQYIAGVREYFRAKNKDNMEEN